MFSSTELLYGGFWEHEHHTSTPSHPSPPSQSHAHSTSRHHTFALTFVLQATRDQFRELCACVDAIKSVWPDPNSGRLSFMKHFFYEVNFVKVHVAGSKSPPLLSFATWIFTILHLHFFDTNPTLFYPLCSTIINETYMNVHFSLSSLTCL